MVSRRSTGRLSRPALPNPYDLSTWRDATPAGASGSSGAADAASGTPPSAPSAAEHRAQAAPEPKHLNRSGAPFADTGNNLGPAGDETADETAQDPSDLPDPPELPRLDDPFELARRTLNRSRAAARDRGLFAISRKTQTRRLREKDHGQDAPGYSGAHPDPRDPQSISSVMRKVLADMGWNEGMNAGRVLEEWDEIVGERVAAHCQPVSLEGGVLVISADSSAWASQMRMISAHLITTIEKHVGAHVISELTVTGPAAAQRTWKKGARTVTWRGVRDTYG